ncbi:MAG TPA: ABC transporter substrate-binding protein [Solirubrobacteraceae bacterium]|jgi:peptide/nickel transport system substrate-binding protein
MATPASKLDALRIGRSEIDNHYLDELAAGRLSRREFVRRGAAIGFSSTFVAAALAACGNANSSTSSAPSSSATPAKGGTLKLASQTPTGAINPITISDLGGSTMLTQTGEFLTFDNAATGRLEPMLATSWSHNGNGSVWTFKLRTGVKFHNGKEMNADDVVYTFKQQTDPKNAAVALSTFEGVLKPEGVVRVDPTTVAFHLEQPNGNFPYIISSDNYNLIIVPAGTDFGHWQKTFVGTGPFKLSSYTQNQGADFVANHSYWGGPPHLSGTSFLFYASQQSQIVALQGGQVDVVSQFTAQGAQALLKSSNYRIIKVRSASHRELSMRNDMAPFTDPRVRQAIALSIDRPSMVSALLEGDGQVGNDNPFAPKFASTNTSVPQRTQDLSKAKQLLSAAGHPNGFETTLTAGQQEEIPALAQVFAAEAAKIGVKINLKIETLGAYYGKSTYGNSDWLDAIMSLVEYGDRGVPNVFLEAPLESTGPWNAARFKNKTYDGLVSQYIGAVDLQTQRTIAGKIERLLLEQTPLVIPYFADILAATTTKVQGVQVNGFAIFLGHASMT